MSQPTDLRKLLIELRDFLRDRNHSMWSYVESGTQAEDMANLADRIDAALAEVVEPVAWIEHHKAGDNLNWERVDHSYAKATPLYAAPQSDDRAGMLRDEVMSLYDAEIAKGGSADFERADQNALAAFDPRTKVCTMNCGPTVGDPRSQEERRFLCPDCVTVPVPSRNRANDLFSALLEFHNAFCNRDETTSLHVWNERMKSADENAVAVLNAAPHSASQPEAMVTYVGAGKRWVLQSPDGRMFFGESPLAALREERNSRMSAAEQLENIRKGMEAESQPDTVAVPIHQLEHWAEYWNGSANEKAMSDALEHILGEVDDLLRAAQEAK